MKHHAVLVSSIIFVFIVLGGCSGGGQTPLIPDIPNMPGGPAPQPSDRGTEDGGLPGFNGMNAMDPNLKLGVQMGKSDGHYLTLLYEITLDPVTGLIDVVPARAGMKHYEVSKYVLPPECNDCLTMVVQNVDYENHIYDVNVTLKNSTDLVAYDVRGIAFIGKDGDDRDIVNADNYTKRFDPGNPAAKNPYRGFKATHPKRAFHPDETSSVLFQLYFPPPPKFNILFAIDISWPKNMKEPYDIINQLASGGLDTTGSAPVNITCTVKDWQDDIESVQLEVSELAGAPELVQMIDQGNGEYSVDLFNTWGTIEGQYKIEIQAKSVLKPGLLYDYLDIMVVDKPNDPPIWFMGEEGILSVTPSDSSVEITYGMALDPNEPVTYNIYASSTSPIDFDTITPMDDLDGSPYTYLGLINDQEYFFAVRAEDGLGLEDENIIELSATPYAINYPPQWLDVEGILGVGEGPYQVSVFYGEAIDPHTPVTYTVYYDILFDFDWATAQTLEGNPGSPTIVPDLENGVTYMFGVRAVDSLGLSDENENIAPGMPMNQAPYWEGFPGGIDAAIPGDGQVEVQFGTAVDPDEITGPVVYNVYWSTDPFLSEDDFLTAGSMLGQAGSPVIVAPLPNDFPFYFVVRAADEFGLEEKNMFSIQVAAQNQPPTWDSTIGVQNLIPGNATLTVEYGTASDPDTPVTYNVYYALSEFGFWELAEVQMGETGSPTVISDLMNDFEYFVGVRAQDSEGAEDFNEVILSATPTYDNQPPTWDTTVGVQGVTSGDMEVTVLYGTASDPDTPIRYTVYYGTTSPLDFVTAQKVISETGSPTVISPLSNGEQLYFAVRAQDGLGLEETNIVELPGMALNEPPVWDTTVGIVDVQANDEYALVYFGTASDPSLPVTYNVYWDTQTPIDFGTADSSQGNDTSPVYVSNLTNDQQYWFAVRAEDGDGLEDTNIVEITDTPTEQPPTWDTTIGIQAANYGNQQVTVMYGAASDPDLPVTYNVYYSLSSPIDFGTADVMAAQIGSPTIVTNLTNDLEYYFAVKARDATGMEDANIVEIAATPHYDNTAPIWENFPGGIETVFAGDHMVTVNYGVANDPDLPVTYNVYWSESTPIDFGTADKQIGETGSPAYIYGLTNEQQYFFAVRAMDGLGLEDTNTVEMIGMPMNEPPEWDSTIGITNAVPGNTEVTVEYGTASDPDVPVTYTVYYSQESPIHFDTASKIEGETGSPTTVIDLTNGELYFFAVRARDFEGLEDENVEELSATPTDGNDPPTWEFETGILSVTPLSESVEVTYGVANDPHLPVTYRLYYQEEAPIDWSTTPFIVDDGSPGTIPGLDNSKMYFFGVRAVDGLGAEDQNNVMLSESPNLPPVWDSTVGVTGVKAMLGAVEVSFGTASDVDGVTYTIHYSKNTPLNFDFADTITGLTSSPHVVAGLNPGETWYFGVRAVDGNDLAETNTNEAGTTVWNDPMVKWVAASGFPIESSPNRLDVNGDSKEDVIIGGQDGNISAFDAETGFSNWSYPVGSQVNTSPCVTDVNGAGLLDVVAGSDDGSVYAVSGNDGSIIWSFPTAGAVKSSPAAGDVDFDGDQDVVFGSYDYSVYVVDCISGTEVWHAAGGDRMASSPALYDINGDSKLEVFIGNDDGKLYCFDGDGSGEIWSYTTSQPVSVTPVIGDVENDGDKEVIFVSDDGYLYVLDAATGAFRWNFNIGSISNASPVLGDVNEDGLNDIAIGAADGTYYLINSQTHTALWSASYASPFNGPAVIVDLSGDGILDVLAGSDDGNLYCFDGNDGTEAFAINTGFGVKSSTIVYDIDDDGLLEIVFGSTAGLILAFDTSVPVPSGADMVWPKYQVTTDNRGVL